MNVRCRDLEISYFLTINLSHCQKTDLIALKGFQGSGEECSDIDECTDRTHNCATDATCENNDGGYDCKCNQGSRTKHDFNKKIFQKFSKKFQKKI